MLCAYENIHIVYAQYKFHIYYYYYYYYYKNIPFPKAPGRKTIAILIGSDHPELTLALTECYGAIGGPVARRTPLEWTCVGRISALPSAKRITYARNFRIQTLYETHLDEQLRRMWEIDSLGVRNSDDNQLNQEEILALPKVEKSRRWIGGRSSHFVEGRVPILT